MNINRWLLSIGFVIVVSLAIEFISIQQCEQIDTPTIETWVQAGNIDEAYKRLSQALICVGESQPAQHITLLRLRSNLYADQFDYTNAGLDLDRAITLVNDDSALLAELLIQRGKVFLLKYEWDHAETDFTEAIRLNPTSASAYFERGILFYTMAQREQALTDFETARSLDPESPNDQMIASYIDSIRTELQTLRGN